MNDVPWKINLTSKLIVVGLVVGGIGTVAGTIAAWHEELWSVFYMNLAGYSLLVAVSFLPRSLWKIKIAVFHFLVGGVGVVLILETGQQGAGFYYLALMPLLSVLFFDLRTMLVSYGFFTLVMIGVGVGVFYNLIPNMPGLMLYCVKYANFYFFVTLLGTCFRVILAGYEKALEREARVTAQILEEKERVDEALTQKNYLLKEVHHRVKNNFQVISSLLSLQAGFSREKSRDLLTSRNRIQVMALAYEFQFLVDYRKGVSLKELMAHLFSQNTQLLGIAADYEWIGTDVMLNVDGIMTLALVLHEYFLAMEEERFLFRAELSGEADGWQLKLFANLPVKNPDPLSLQLLELLTGQLGSLDALVQKPEWGVVMTLGSDMVIDPGDGAGI